LSSCAPSCQEMESPATPGQFTLLLLQRFVKFSSLEIPGTKVKNDYGLPPPWANYL